MTSRGDIDFPSGRSGERCRAWLYSPEAAQAPLVLMAHGLGAVKEMRLDAFAERFADAGLAALVFDYRHFGDSTGEPRQLIDIGKQHDDWRAAVAFARGLGDAACVKHFPGLGTAPVSTDDRPHVDARIRPRDLAPFRAAIRAGVPCVMVSNAFYGTRFRASIEPSTYRRLRRLGFDGVAITDSLSLVRKAPVERWARQAARAGADMLLFTSPAHARRAVRALVPLARRGELDRHVERILRLRARVRDRS